MSHEVLVLNSDYEPLNVCNMKRAISLMFLGKVDVLHTNSAIIHTISGSFDLPSVVRLRRHVRRPMPELRLSRRSIFARDNYTCQYCGHTSKELTIDHVIPKRLGGATTWDNLVCCCRKCNTKKGDKSLQKVCFTLKRLPRRPKYVPFISLTKYLDGARNTIWRDYLPIFDDVPAQQQAINEEGN
ncbi:MAG: HNH endonuclease [Armatimonadota bacterium]|nr:HNH endonuclease [Armatimonadota bacterium]